MKIWHIDAFAFVCGLAALLLFAFGVNWYAAAGLFLGILGNNAMINAQRMRHSAAQIRFEHALMVWVREFIRARSAAPGGVGNPNTNTEAEVAGTERP